MTCRVELTSRAERDLQRLYKTLDASHSATTKTRLGTFEGAVLGLETTPGRHPVTPENSGLRHLLVRSKSYVYRVIFQINEQDRIVTVLHIRHGSRSNF